MYPVIVHFSITLYTSIHNIYSLYKINKYIEVKKEL